MNQGGQRLVYANAKNTLLRNGINPGRAVLSQSYLRTEAVLTTTQTQYNLNVLVNDTLQPAFATAQLLNLQDSFIVSSIFIGVAKAATTATSETNVPLYSYNDPSAFSTAGAAAALVTLYGGAMNLTVNQRVIVPTWDIYRHYHAPIMQTAQTPTGAGTVTNSFSYDKDGFYPVEPNIVLVGSKKNQLQITLPSAISTLQAAPASTRLVVIFRGLLAQNITSVH